jgi:hypothetical protein
MQNVFIDFIYLGQYRLRSLLRDSRKRLNGLCHTRSKVDDLWGARNHDFERERLIGFSVNLNA